MKLLVVGSRGIKEYDLEKHIPKETTLIITGGADGIDSLAEKYADRKGISKLVLRPQYSLFKRNAPLKRNEIIDAIPMDLVGFSVADSTTPTIAVTRTRDKKEKRTPKITEPVGLLKNLASERFFIKPPIKKVL